MVTTLLFAGSIVSGEIDQIEGRYMEDVVRFDVRFSDPRPPGDGWTFQIFVDTDDNPDTGYGDGYELLVRGVEMTPDPNDVPGVSGGSVFLRRTDSGEGPGGWGIDVDVVPTWTRDEGRRLAIEVTLNDELESAAFRFAFESYYEGERIGEDDKGRTHGFHAPACVNLKSYETFSDCITGPDQSIVPASQFCLLAFDYDGDSDVDVHDFASMPQCPEDQP